MLVNKKAKIHQQKPKSKPSQSHLKKPKKLKTTSSPQKSRLTPDKKRVKKDQNVVSNKINNASIQHSDYYKSKQSIKPTHKKSQMTEAKSRLLTTSPIFLGNKSKSKSKSKQKSKSKSRSVSKLNTFRSTQQKDINRSVIKKLFVQKENKQKSKQKSRSRSRLKTDRDVSPLRQIKQVRKFDVTDREIKYNKNETIQLKKKMKKKIMNNKVKQDIFYFPPKEKEEIVQEQPKLKFKKKVPQIKTQFSERRGSYFDQNLLKKLQLNQLQVRKVDPCPFSHIKSNFQQRVHQIQQISSSQSSKISKKHFTNSTQSKQVQSLKKQQEMKWNLMLNELKNLKNEPQMNQKIDKLIEYLTDNYVRLQQKASQIQSSHHIHTQKLNSYQIDKSYQSKPQQQIQKIQIEIDPIKETNPQQKISIIQKSLEQLQLLSPIIDQVALSCDPQHPSSEKAQLQKQFENVQPVFKRSNNINLSQFYNFMNKDQNNRRSQFQPFLKLNSNDIEHYSMELLQMDEHKLSDKNILHALSILDRSSDFIEISNQAQMEPSEFKKQMQSIRKQQDRILSIKGQNSFHNEVKLHQQISEQSMLLSNNQLANQKTQKMVEEVLHTLILDFCSIILRSKNILHNFITTYSQLVDNNVINVDLVFDQPRNQIQCDEDFIKNIFHRLINHIQVNYKQQFLNQIKIPFQCKPLQILRYIRSSEDELMEQSSESDSQNFLMVPYLNQEKIQEFQIDVLKNEYFVRGYFSFNNCIYDTFNDIFEELRPYGNQGKPIFSLELSHPHTNFQEIKQKMIEKLDKQMKDDYLNIGQAQFRFQKQEGNFEFIYYTCLDVIDLIFEEELLIIDSVFAGQKRGIF